MVDINLLPEEKSEVRRRKAFIPLLSQNVSLIVSSVLFVVVLAVSLALLGYRLYLEKQITALDQQISALTASFDPHILEQMTAFDNQIKTVKKILDVHTDGSRLFSFIEENTLHQVVWTNFNADPVKAEISVLGRASTYSILAKQISYLSSLPSVNGVSVSGITLSSEGGVQFSLKIDINPREFTRR